HPLLSQRLALWAEIQDPALLALPRLGRANRRAHRAGLHQHPGTTAIRLVVYRTMPVMRVIARAVVAQIHQILLHRPRGNSVFGQSTEHAGEECDDGYLHCPCSSTNKTFGLTQSQSGCQSTSMTPPSRSTFCTTWGT